MKIEDCKRGVKVRCISERPKGASIIDPSISKGDILTIDKIKKENHYNEPVILFEEISCVWWPGDFEPVNKFEVGDEVIYKSFDSQTIKTREEAIIFGIAPEKDKLNREYAISYIHEGPYGEKKRVNEIVAEHKLLPLKKPDELEIGDKFKDVFDKYDEVVTIIAKAYDPFRDCQRYFGRYENCGIVDVWSENDIEEIIYD